MIRTKERASSYGQETDHFLHTGVSCHHFLMLLWVHLDHWRDVERPRHSVPQMRRLLHVAGRGRNLRMDAGRAKRNEKVASFLPPGRLPLVVSSRSQILKEVLDG